MGVGDVELGFFAVFLERDLGRVGVGDEEFFFVGVDVTGVLRDGGNAGFFGEVYGRVVAEHAVEV